MTHVAKLCPDIGKSMKKIQMVDLRSQYERLQADIDQAMQGVLERTSFINGEEVKVFAADLGKYLDCPSVIPCGNGTDALQLVMMAMDFRPGQEVIVPAFTYIAAVEVLALLGLRPVLVDVHPETFQIDAKKIAAAITANTVGIVPVHLFGQCADMGAIMEIAETHGLKVIEDAAQSLGAVYTMPDGSRKHSGTIGHAGTTSFFPSKTLGCFGDGGAAFTNDPELGQKIRMIANHGQRQKYFHERIGVNSRLDTLQAAILQAKLPHLDDFVQRRNAVAKAYNQAFALHPHIRIPQLVPNSTHAYHQYTLRIRGANRDELRDFLKNQGIPTMVYYPLPVHLQPAYRYLGYKEGDFPVAEQLCNEVLSLPIHTEMEEDQLDHIISEVKRFFA